MIKQLCLHCKMKSLIYLILIFPVGFCNDNPIVDCPAGKFKGHILKTRNGRDVLSFQGIPYALPPTGSLRYKDPVKKPKINELYESTDDSHECYQPIFDLSKLKNMDEFKGTEDCLYLNVYAPKMENSKEKLPVFIWIHGGGYYMASKSAFYNGPEFFLDKDMILVTINYRLGVLGFLSTGDKILPGNLGLKDQIMAIEWVKENIESFGGDPNLITIGGESAGGAAVTQHMHSKKSKGLFQRAIAQSGSIDCIWSTKTKHDARATAEKFSLKVKCPINDKFIECLQQKSINELFLNANEIKDKRNVLHMDFVPVIEDESLDAILTENSIKEPSDVPLLIGVTSRESVAMPLLMALVNSKYVKLSAMQEDYKKLIPLITYFNNNPQAEEIAEKLVKFYFGKDGITDDSQGTFVNLIGDVMFNYPVYLRAKKHQGKTYMYMFSYKGNVNLSPFNPKGLQDQVGHSEDLLFMFNFNFMPHGKMSRRDREISDVTVDSWYNFIKYGDPTPESKVWTESERGLKYLDITNKGLMMKSNMFEDRMRFLNTIDFDMRNILTHDEL